MKINKACDLNSISVFPPPLVYPRKANNISSGLQASHSQHRSQPSQQSLSQGLSSQHGVLSHFSQNSLDEAVTTNDQRVGSQEHENSLRRISSLSRPTYSREESQAPNSRSSSNLMLKWNSADHKSQLSEGLEHRIGIMETSLSRFTMILDSVQSDVMQSTSKQITTPKMRQPLANEAKVSIQATVAPEVESGGWKPVKKERVTFSDRTSEKVQKKKEPHTQKYIRGGRDCAIVIESDEEIDGGFSCLVQENAGVNLLGNLTKEALEETERILRKARRRKRKTKNSNMDVILMPLSWLCRRNLILSDAEGKTPG
ncbi:hypothetical protein JHK87_017707 [Glycine soja]|nr:hypothetical protein JHK87_017707 [Glycine soja]